MYKTTYHRASSVDDALSLVGKADDGKFLSGGMTLLPTMKARLAAPSDLVDLAHIKDLHGITVSGSTVKIGATTTHSEVNASAEVAKAIPALAQLAGHIGDPAVRHRGTIGGSVANNDPAADYPAAVLALNGTVHTNKRDIPADDFFVDLFETALEDGEIIKAVTFQVPAQAAYQKFPNPASRYAMAGVFVAKFGDGAVRVGVTGAGNRGAYRHAEMEAALKSNFSADAVANIKNDPSKMNADIHGSAEYRASLVTTMAKRAVAAAAGG